jgi:hypothetical protein
MALLKQLYFLVLPLLLFTSIPLALFATLTSILALAILLFRVLLIYAELAIAVIPYYVLGFHFSSQSTNFNSVASADRSRYFPITSGAYSTSPTSRRRLRRNSSATSDSHSHSSSITPVGSEAQLHIPLSSSVGAARDFEGVGGWRVGGADDDVLWTSMNSRLELPADHVRRHRRSATSGSQNFIFRSEKTILAGAEMATQVMESNVGRARTPLENLAREREEYFGVGVSPKTIKKQPSIVTSTSVSSGSSKGSGLNMKRF